MKEIYMDDLKTRLRFYMRESGLNPTSLSRKAQLNATAVRDILEHPKTPNPRIDTFIKLCRALGVKPGQLSPDMEKLCIVRSNEDVKR
jgi:hypothetical protein